jgi:hypothetical protein
LPPARRNPSPYCPIAGGFDIEGDPRVTHRISPALFIEEGPVVELEAARSTRSTALLWKLLDEQARLEMIERQLRPANDQIDAFPLAL